MSLNAEFHANISFINHNPDSILTYTNSAVPSNKNEIPIYMHSISVNEYNELFELIDSNKTCPSCGKLEKVHYKFGNDTRCFTTSLHGGFDRGFYQWFEAIYKDYIVVDFSNEIIYIHFKKTETFDTPNWKKFKFGCEGLFRISVERLQHFRNQYKKRICKQINGGKYNKTYRDRKKETTSYIEIKYP